MSYLIAMYVYYHGNNLAVFGIHKGETLIEEHNAGMKHIDEADRELINPHLYNDLKQQEEKQKQYADEMNYNSIMQSMMKQSQDHSYQLYKAGLIESKEFDNTVDLMLTDYDDASIPLDFFTEINGGKK